jgi:hypothetical protein
MFGYESLSFLGSAFLDLLQHPRAGLFLGFGNAVGLMTSFKVLKLKFMLLWTVHEAKYLCIFGTESLFKSFVGGQLQFSCHFFVEA